MKRILVVSPLRKHGFIVLFGKIYFVPRFQRVRQFARFVRGLLPSAYSASFYCCDSRRFYAGRAFIVAGDWHLRKIEPDLEASSDGTQVDAISLRSYFSLLARRELSWRD